MSAVSIDTAIAALTVTGLTVKGLSAIPQQVQPRDCPILFPADTWLGQTTALPGVYDNSRPAPLFTVENSLSYILAYAPDGAGRGISDQLSGMATLLQAFISKVFEIDLPMVVIRRVTVNAFGQVTDPTGSKFYGVMLTITASEYVPKGGM